MKWYQLEQRAEIVRETDKAVLIEVPISSILGNRQEWAPKSAVKSGRGYYGEDRIVVAGWWVHQYRFYGACDCRVE